MGILDAQLLRRVLYDFFKFNKSDFSVSGSGTGFLVSLLKKSATAAPVFTDSFDFILQDNGDGDKSDGGDGTDWQLIVSANTNLFDGTPDDELTPTNLETIDLSGIADDDPPAKDDPGWLDVKRDGESGPYQADMIWLLLNYDTSSSPYTISSTKICSLGNGDTWDGGSVENDGGKADMDGNTPYTQTKARILIGTTSVDDKTGFPVKDMVCRKGCMITVDGGYFESNDSKGGSDQVILASFAVPF